jgi:hypothetical protein
LQLRRRRLRNKLGILAGKSTVELGLIELLNKLGDEKLPCEVGYQKETNHIEGLQETTDVPEHVQDRVNLAIINVIPLIEANIHSNYRSVISTDLVIIVPNILNLREVIFILLSQLKDVVLHLHLRLHHV